ncbi:large-conductance mechanosensitive channel protein MscL [Amnimonas aquatica]|uniref:Large-conductance mechanosensitive channel n=1 Tax=Amnimonas aquatica TaxID=2094561 RepID=A0A2P6AUM2_9GAMM|nr:large-conductance mechanosensitive channel protein MscL [Amnimonas aquatica]PQA50142.1 large conductance mechanosensitive channel protein MscL [Amnimonas aquatica]
MSLIKEFREFAMRGNVIDLAVGVIIGAAFGKIVSSFVGDIVMPPLGVLVGGVNFSDLAVTLKAAEGDAPAVLLAYGKFIQSIFDFVIIAFAVMMGVKAVNSLKRAPEPEAPAAPPAPSAEETLLAEIRDLLKQQKA